MGAHSPDADFGVEYSTGTLPVNYPDVPPNNGTITDEVFAVLFSEPGSPEWTVLTALAVSPAVSTFEAVFGLEPDLFAAGMMTGAHPGALIEVFDCSDDHLCALFAGQTQLELREALLVCRSFGWPLASLVWNGNDWHPRTKRRLAYGEELPF